MRPLLRLVAAALLAIAAVHVAPAAAQDGWEGTYELIICPGPCEPADVESRPQRILVSLYDDSLFGGPLAGEQPERYPMLLQLWNDPRTANACFSMRQRPGATFIGIRRQALTSWRADTAGTITFPLYRSPDAGSEVTVRRTAEGLVGQVEDWSAFGPRPSSRMAYVAARRMGPPDPGVCGVRDRVRQDAAASESSGGTRP